MAQRSSEAEGAFGYIKKNFGYSLLDAWLQEVGAIRKGRGIHPVAKLKRELGSVAKSLFSYALAKDILGERNSFSKTDPDATMMHMKYDYYNHTNVFKPGYNVQIGVNNGYIALYQSGCQ